MKAQSGSMMMMPEATEMIDMGEGRDSHFRRRKRSILMSSFSEVRNVKKIQFQWYKWNSNFADK